MITISILIPVYNSGELLAKCIDSVLSQTVLPDEILIIDDCPEFPMTEIIKRYNSSIIHYFLNTVNIGRTKNYKKLLEYSSSEYVLILDGDDQLCNNDFISEAKEKLNGGNFIAFSGGCINNYNEQKIERRLTKQSKPINGYEYFKSWTSAKQTLPHSSTIFRKDLALKSNYYTIDIINTDILSQRLLLLQGNLFLSKNTFSQWNFTGKNSSSIESVIDFVNNYKTISIPYRNACKQYGYSISLFAWLIRTTYRQVKSVTLLLFRISWKKIINYYILIILHFYKNYLFVKIIFFVLLIILLVLVIR